MNWQYHLREIHVLLMNKPSDITRDRDRLATKLMQDRYPGNYRVVENFDPARGCFGFKLEFDDPREETMFLLNWS